MAESGGRELDLLHKLKYRYTQHKAMHTLL